MSIIEVKNLVKKFKIKNGEFIAVNNASFDVKRGEIFAFLGPNGAGKTTIIKIITTLLHPTSGEVKLNGFDVVLNPNEARKSFGIVFQDPSLDDELTAYENMEIHGVLYNLPKDLLKNALKNF
jgi:ABC-2 type transport system ATP-binding protein